MAEKTQSVKISAEAMRQLNEICERCKPLGKQGLIELAVSRLARQVKEKGLNALDVTEDKEGHRLAPATRPLEILRGTGASRLPLRK